MADAIKLVTRTVYGAAMQTSKHLRIPYDVLRFTTINEALDIDDIVPFQPNPKTRGMQYAQSYNADTDTGSLGIQYFCIGNGGHTIVSSGTEGIPFPKNKPHRSKDSGLYNILPFIIKPLEADLSRDERDKYRLRKVLEIAGELYVAYYARKMNVNKVAPVLVHTRIQDGIAISTPFVPSINDLNPPDPIIGQENDGSLLSVTSKIVIDFDEQDVLRLKEACEILYGNANYAIISEIAICSGAEKSIIQEYPTGPNQTSENISSQNLFEAVAVQPVVFIGHFFSAMNSSQGFTSTFDLGAAEPLFAST